MDYLTLINAASFLPARLVFPYGWIGHTPFAGWLIKTIEPSIFVELGTHSGNSYLAFCQSVKENKTQTRCYAVDTWKGDEHSGFYGDEIFSDLYDYHERNYFGFSRLMRMTFDEGTSYFADNSIELLHIDGLHTYDAVKHDFENWLPKLSPHAVILFHDTNVRGREFGVWKLWVDLCNEYPLRLEFNHSNGLGVIQLSKGQRKFNLDWLEPDFDQRILRDYFASIGQNIIEKYELKEKTNNLIDQQLNQEKRIINLMEQSSQQLSTQAKQIRVLEEQIKEQVQKISDEEAQIQALEETKIESAHQMQELGSVLSERARQVRVLNGRLTQTTEELQDAKNEILEYALSSSWQITRSFRKIKNHLSRGVSK